MQTALTINSRKVIAGCHRLVVFCDCCGSRVVAKIGTGIHRPHFAHPAGRLCSDTWYEPESEWHHEWKEQVPINRREVAITNDGVSHIADIQTPTKNVIVELQYSSLLPKERDKRIIFYKKIIFLIHINQIREHNLHHPDSYVIGCDYSLYAKPEPWITKPEFTFPLFIDLCNEELFHVKSMVRLNGATTILQGRIITKPWFVDSILNNSKINYSEIYPGYEQNIMYQFKWLFVKHKDDQRMVFVTENNERAIFYCPDCGKIRSTDKIPAPTSSENWMQCPRCETYFTYIAIPFDPNIRTIYDDDVAIKQDIKQQKHNEQQLFVLDNLQDPEVRNTYKNKLRRKLPSKFTNVETYLWNKIVETERAAWTSTK